MYDGCGKIYEHNKENNMNCNTHISFYDLPVLLPVINFINDDPTNKGRYLLLVETYNISPQNYDTSKWKQYKGIITWNRRLYSMHRRRFNMHLIPQFPYMKKTLVDPSKLVSYEEKLGDVSLMCRYREKSEIEFDITHLRYEAMNELNKHMHNCHTYGKIEYGGDMYKGAIGYNEQETEPSSASKIIMLNKYKFNICFENCYHDVWSYDYITEKIYDCFAAKTIPIYYGCYNTKGTIPQELFIDYRNFNSTEDLVEHLNKISPEEYNEIVDIALDWYTKNFNPNIWLDKVNEICSEK